MGKLVAKSAKAIERSIRRLEKEIAEIDSYFYFRNRTKDRSRYEGMLERKRDDIVRAGVLQLHTAIEDMIDGIIISRVLGVRPDTRFRTRGPKARALRSLIAGSGSLGFDAKISLALGLGLIRSPVRARLKELNSIRNKCSHQWLLRAAVRRGRRPRQTKPPLLSFRGKDLHKVAAFKEFSAEYGLVYAKLFGLLYTGRYSAR